jgi:hypothetical protein
MSCTAIAKSIQTRMIARRSCVPHAPQRGAASLFVVLVLLLAMILIVLAMARVGVQEQAISASDQRADKAINAAQAGLEYGMTWLTKHFSDAMTNESWPNNGPFSGSLTSPPTPENIDSIFSLSDSTAGLLEVPNDVIPSAGERYVVRVVMVDIGTGTPRKEPYIQVTSYARDFNDPSVTSTVRQYAIAAEIPLLQPDPWAPLTINGCFLNDTTGNPHIMAATPTGLSIWMGTSALTTAECPDPPDPKGICRDPTDPDWCPTTKQHPVLIGTEENTLSGSTAAWDALFPHKGEEGRNRFKELADSEKGMSVSERHFFYIDPVDKKAQTMTDFGQGANWHLDLGSGNVALAEYDDGSEPPCGTTSPRYATDAVVLYFGSNAGKYDFCPNINGSTVIWGLVYYEGCAGGGQGFGGGHVFGAVAAESNVNKINSNTTVCGTDNVPAGLASDDWRNKTFARVPGTWSQP